MEALRYDLAPLRATRTDEGYLVDVPVVGRTGILTYYNADGSTRRELRRPEEVFHADSLASFAGKPVTDEHPATGRVTAQNAKALSVGVIQGPGREDGENVLAPIIIHDAETIDKVDAGGKRELSLGYKVDLVEGPGEWNGEKYDAEQTNIRINHLAIVKRGRAGNARLNLDRLDAASYNPQEVQHMPDNLTRVRLDGGLEYPAAPEVVLALDKARNDAAALQVHNDALQAQLDKTSAERDAFKAQVVDADKVRADALAAARSEITARVALEKTAEEFKVDHAGKSDREIREAVVRTIRADADLSGKSDAYVDAAFDLAVEQRNDAGIVEQRKTVTTPNRADVAPADSGYAAYKARLGKKD